MKLLSCINGQILPAEEVKISSSDFSFLYGIGLFETLRTWGGKLFALEKHWQRLNDSVQRIGSKLQIDLKTLTEWIQRTVNANGKVLQGGQDLRLRLTVTAGTLEANQSFWEFDFQQSTVIIHAKPLPPDFDERNETGWKAVLIPWRRHKDFPLLQIKTTSYLANALSIRYAKERGSDEGLWLNTENRLTEGIITNLFLVQDGKLLTPPPGEGLLKGIARQIVMELAKSMDVPVLEKPIPLEMLYEADEVFVTNAVIGVVALIQVEDKTFPNFPLTKALRNYYLEKAVKS